MSITQAFEKYIHKITKTSHQKIFLGNGFTYNVDEKMLVKDGQCYELKKKEILLCVFVIALVKILFTWSLT